MSRAFRRPVRRVGYCKSDCRVARRQAHQEAHGRAGTQCWRRDLKMRPITASITITISISLENTHCLKYRVRGTARLFSQVRVQTNNSPAIHCMREPDPAWSGGESPPEEQREQLCAEIEEQIADKSLIPSIGTDASNRGPSLSRRQFINTTTPASMAAFQMPSGFFADWTRPYCASSHDTIANNFHGRALDLIQGSWHTPFIQRRTFGPKGHLANNSSHALVTGQRWHMCTQHQGEASSPRPRVGRVYSIEGVVLLIFT